jgi:uncharacterized small protein (DUF1192 family)
VTDFETVREAALQDEVKELEAEVEEKQAYCVWADKRIGDLEHEVERLRAIETLARAENDAVLGLMPTAYAALRHVADPLRAALAKEEA